MKYCDLRLIENGCLHRSTVEAEIGSVACYLSVGGATNSSIARKHVVINSLRGSVGTTYLEPTHAAFKRQKLMNGEGMKL